MGYAFYTHFTLTPYGKEMESCLPPKPKLPQAFIKLSKQTSPQRVVWRYDPIIVDADHSITWRIEQFTEMCGELHPYTKRCILSFIDLYKSISDKFRAMTQDEMLGIASGFSDAAQKYDMALYTCAEEIEPEHFVPVQPPQVNQSGRYTPENKMRQVGGVREEYMSYYANGRRTTAHILFLGA